jgi:hypothetical protein
MYVGLASDEGLLFLGYSEDGMRIAVRENFLDYHTDTLGPKIPFDVQRFQADALITGDLVRWNESVLQLMEDRSKGVNGLVRGVQSLAEVGAWILAQDKTYRFLCDAPNVVSPAAAIWPNMIPYNFLAAYLHETMERRRGSKVERVHIVMRALTDFVTPDPVTGKMPKTAVLYNADRSGIPPFAPN